MHKYYTFIMFRGWLNKVIFNYIYLFLHETKVNIFNDKRYIKIKVHKEDRHKPLDT